MASSNFQISSFLHTFTHRLQKNEHVVFTFHAVFRNCAHSLHHFTPFSKNPLNFLTGFVHIAHVTYLCRKRRAITTAVNRCMIVCCSVKRTLTCTLRGVSFGATIRRFNRRCCVVAATDCGFPYYCMTLLRYLWCILNHFQVKSLSVAENNVVPEKIVTAPVA